MSPTAAQTDYALSRDATSSAVLWRGDRTTEGSRALTSCPHTPCPPGCPCASAAPVPVDRMRTGADEPLNVSLTRPAPGIVVARAVGEIDLATAAEWKRSLFDACSQVAVAPRPCPGGRGTMPRLVCDLTAVGFLGATGLAVLVELSDRARRLGVALRLVVDSPAVRRPLELTRVDRLLTLDRRLVDAVAVADDR